MKNTKQVTEKTQKKFLEFRELQLMAIQYRLIYSKYFLNVNTVSIIILAVLCLYNSITAAVEDGEGSKQLGLSILYFWCAIASALVLLIDYGILGDVHAFSEKALKELKSKIELKQSKWCSKFLKSCPVIRVYIGGSNYFEKLTPLNLWNFVVDQTVSLLLLN